MEVELTIVTRINVKLGGVNMILNPGGPGSITDPINPTIVMGMN